MIIGLFTSDQSYKLQLYIKWAEPLHCGSVGFPTSTYPVGRKAAVWNIYERTKKRKKKKEGFPNFLWRHLWMIFYLFKALRAPKMSPQILHGGHLTSTSSCSMMPWTLRRWSMWYLKCKWLFSNIFLKSQKIFKVQCSKSRYSNLIQFKYLK